MTADEFSDPNTRMLFFTLCDLSRVPWSTMSAPTDGRVEVHIVGPHRVELEWPDIVHIHYGGDVELEHFLAFDEVMLAIPPPTRLLLLRDARGGGVVAQETRRHIASRERDSRLVAIATYGSSFQSKTVFSNMNRAMRTVRQDTVPVAFFETETEARAWLREQKAESSE